MEGKKRSAEEGAGVGVGMDNGAGSVAHGEGGREVIGPTEEAGEEWGKTCCESGSREMSSRTSPDRDLLAVGFGVTGCCVVEERCWEVEI